MIGEPLLLIGAGGHASACIDVIEQEGRFTILGLIGLISEVGTTILNYPVLGTDAELSSLRQQCANALITVGQIKTPSLRIHLFTQLETLGFQLPVVISPHAYVSRHTVVGAGTIIMHYAVVNAGASIGRNCILNTHSLVEHDVVIGDHCHISTNAAVNSGVQIGNGSFIGSGSSVRQCLTIGERCVIGMGQHVLIDCLPDTQVPPRKRKQ